MSHLNEKIEKTESILDESRSIYNWNHSALAWTGGKDSTLLLWIVKNYCEKKGLSFPKIVFIDEGDLFEEVVDFVEKIIREWNLNVERISNSDVISQATKIGDIVEVSKLSKTNKKELERIGFREKTFPFEPESYVGNHLMKTVAINEFIKKYNIEVLMTGIRWDEQEARKDDKYFEEKSNPRHIRVQPILHFTERDVWNIIKEFEIPFNSLYGKGYRSLGVKSTTKKHSDVPAWKQDLENTYEREGRSQGKEKIMTRLRDLGYM